VVLTFGSGVLWALFLNDTIALILTPLVLGLAQSLNLNPIPYLLALAGATNLGSVAAVTGNPQNIGLPLTLITLALAYVWLMR